MKKQDLLSGSDLLLEKAQKVLVVKAVYSTEEDALCSFYNEAKIAELMGVDARNPLHRCINEIIKKCRRLLLLESQGWPGGVDSAEDSHIDIINYALLHSSILREETSKREGGADCGRPLGRME